MQLLTEMSVLVILTLTTSYLKSVKVPASWATTYFLNIKILAVS